MRILFSMLLVIHGLIHLLGFAQVFHLTPVDLLDNNISKANGLLWLAAALLFSVAAFLFYNQQYSWWLFCLAGLFLSQYLILINWSEASFGTIANVLFLLVTISGYAAWSFNNNYKKEVIRALKQPVATADSLLTEKDIAHLPDLVKKYLHYTGCMGKPKVKNFRVELTGQIRKNAQSDWMPFTCEQYNFIELSTRLFFMKATMKHLSVVGLHCYKNGKAFMDIRLFSLFNVQYQAGNGMDIAETVTFFNDMCCMAPATLIDKRIKWLETEGNKVKATFTVNATTIAAWLYFNDKGELVNFVSDDRYAASENNTMKKQRWSTPVKNYNWMNGQQLAGYADAIYHYPEGDLCYGNFHIKRIDYNCTYFSY